MPTRDPSANAGPRHGLPTCGSSHCSVRRRAAALLCSHILAARRCDCGADLLARSTPQCRLVGTADGQSSYLTVTEAPAASSLPLASSAASLETFSSSGLGALSTRSLA